MFGNNAQTGGATVFGVRLFVKRKLGFQTINDFEILKINI
jgi:hypothetical protein